MKAAFLIYLCALPLAGQATQVSQRANPVSRVVTLLKNLAKQVEEEGKKEEDLYESFVCWGKSVIAQKTDSNTAASSRIDALSTYIADLDAGKIVLTTERQDLEKEVEELTADLDNAKALRDKEKKDYDSAKAEMVAAKKALNSAIKVLDEATKDHKKGTLLAVESAINSGGMAALAAESANLNAAVTLGERFLTKADALFLREIVTGTVHYPSANPNLRKKATFKMSYKARSGKIQDVLKKLLQTFDINLKQTEAKEKQNKEDYGKLTTAKGALLSKAKGSLSKMEVEGAARGLSKKQAEDEKKALETQKKDDARFIKETKDSLKKKKEEWEAREKLRTEEIAAISKAINILHNDDARDLFKKSYDSQGYLFLQVDSETNQANAARKAVSALKGAASRTGDRRLSALAELAAETAAAPKTVKTQFKPIITAIDKMIKLLQDEEKKDLETKESCEKGRMEDTRKAVLAGREIDDKTDAVTKLEEEIKEIEEQIESMKKEKQKVKDELDAAEKMRKQETAEWKKTDADDKLAATTVQSAQKVMQDFYKDKFLFLQEHRQPKVVEGEAPPPPPATWEGDYGTKKGESSGIIAILGMVYEDIQKDLKKAKAEEDEAQTEFDTFKKESEDQMKELKEEIDKQDGIKGKKETDRTDTIKERDTKKGEWDTIMKKMEDIAPNCEYYAVNYKMRASNRQIELDGLHSAKAVLSQA